MQHLDRNPDIRVGAVIVISTKVPIRYLLILFRKIESFNVGGKYLDKDMNMHGSWERNYSLIPRQHISYLNTDCIGPAAQQWASNQITEMLAVILLRVAAGPGTPRHRHGSDSCCSVTAPTPPQLVVPPSYAIQAQHVYGANISCSGWIDVINCVNYFYSINSEETVLKHYLSHFMPSMIQRLCCQCL